MNREAGEEMDKDMEKSPKENDDGTDMEKPEAKQETDGGSEDLKQKLEILEKAVQEKQKELDEYKNRWYRAQADFDNFRKRSQKEIQDMHLYAGEQLLKDILPVVDNFERAMDSVQDKENPIYQGIRLIYQQFKNVLERHDVKEIDAQGKAFDPRFHEAVMQIESQEYENDTIIEVLQKGYLYHEKVIRPSMVKVAKK